LTFHDCVSSCDHASVIVTFTLLSESFAVARLNADAPLPEWARGEFVSITRTRDELSIVCRDDGVPADVTAARGWRCLRAEGPFALDETGIAASFVAPLASASISVFIIATYDTDYLLLDGTVLARAIEVLRAAGHRVRTLESADG
jgi:hypothetical protein